MDKYTSKFTGAEIDEKLNKVNQEYTSEEKTKVAALENYDDTQLVAAVNALETNKVNREEGKGLSTNDFTTEEKNKLAVLENYDDTTISQTISDLDTNKANKTDVYTKEETYSKTETDNEITTKVAEIVAGAPEEFDTLKEMSDWLTNHEESAAAMNTAIQKNATDIADRYTKEESDAKYLGKTETAAAAVLDSAGGNIAEQFATINTRTTSIANGYVYSGSTGSNKWYKAAEVSLSEAFACRASTFLVSSTTGASCGILSLILVSKSSSDFGINYARAIWSSNNGITVSNFVVVAKLVNGIITAELWVKITGTYVSYKFARLMASERATISGDIGWSLVTSTTGQDNYPTDYDTTFVSTDDNTGYNLQNKISDLESRIAAVNAQMSTIYGLGTEIPSGSDLNNYTTPGSYYVQTLDISATLINSPATTATFRLEVKYTINTSRCIQMIYLNNTSGAFFMRAYYANKWSSWYKFQGTEVESINTVTME